MAGAAVSAASRARLCRLLVVTSRAAPSRCLTTVAPQADAPTTSQSQEWLNAKPFEEIPGPKKLPIIGSLLSLIPKIGVMSNVDLLEVYQMLRHNYGDIIKVEGIPGRSTMALLFNPDDIEKVFRNAGPFPFRAGNECLIYYRRNVRPDRFRGNFGLVGTQGEEWYDFRNKVNQALLQPRSAKLYVGPIDQVAKDFVNKMAQMRDKNQQMPDDFLNEIHKWSLESVSLVALDTRLGCLEPKLLRDSEPQRIIDSVKRIFWAMNKLDLRLSPWRLISTPTWRQFVNDLDFFYETSMKHINAAMDRIKTKSGNRSTEDISVLERLLLRNDNPGVAYVMAMDMMLAGVDTTSNAATACLFYLAKNPEAQQRLFEEVYAQLPESQSQPLTASKLENCQYLKACLKEALRLRPIAPGNARQCLVDNLVLSGYRIPKGVDLVMGHVQLSRVEQYFPQANQFRPERWLKGPNGTSEAQDAHPFASMPFGHGPRMCIGRRFAELEIYTLMARIIRRFHVEFDGEITWRTNLIVSAASPLKFKITDRHH